MYLGLHIRSRLNTWLQWIRQRHLQDETRNILVLGFGAAYIRGLTVTTAVNHAVFAASLIESKTYHRVINLSSHKFPHKLLLIERSARCLSQYT